MQRGFRADTLLWVRVDDEDSTASALGRAAPVTDQTVLGIAWVHPESRFDPLRGSRVSFGRTDASDVRLDDEQVSRSHAAAVRCGRDWNIVDEDSKNGVFVHGKRVARAELAAQSVIRLGDCIGIVTELQGSVAGRCALTRELAPGLYGGASLAAPFETLSAVAGAELSVVIVGETGTGKEIFARTLHALSGRTGKLVSVNCAALPRNLAESELFGYRQGAFTGAARHHTGYLREADGGTLLLDELTELDRMVQAKLLRALEEREVIPLGDTRPRAVDLRVVAATQRSLHDAVETGTFRADLMARLCGVELHLPPLRQRREEVLELFRVTVREQVGGRPVPRISAALAERLCLYDWPLNVRELVQVARRACVLYPDAQILNLEHVPPRLGAYRDDVAERSSRAPEAPHEEARGAEPSSERPASRAERSLAVRRDQEGRDLETLITLLGEFHGNVNQAAKRMGISRQRAYRLLDLRPDVDVQVLRQSRKGGRE